MTQKKLNGKKEVIHYHIQPSQPTAHIFYVSCEIQDPDPLGEVFALPAWIPGSYLIRDFARHIISLSAKADQQVALVEKFCKDHWCVKSPIGTKSLTLHYEVYAWDLSVRGAHLDNTHAFFNGSSVFLRVIKRENWPCHVQIAPPPGKTYANWRVATSLPTRGKTPALHFGAYQAENYDDLIDHPVEMGHFDLIEFKTRGVAHRLALSGRHYANLDRLTSDLKRICSWQIDFWGAPQATPHYTFLTTVVGDGYGGLEHRASTALICKRNDLPPQNDSTPKKLKEGYRNFLGLAAHEYFHTWLVKRIKPAEFIHLDLQKENPTELLWLFEGFTAYYDDLCLLRCGLLNVEQYLICLSKTIAQVYGAPGRHQQSLAAASFDAWTKFYKADENTPNACISYYAKGALLALGLDLTLREASQGQRSLDDLMRRLWIDYGVTGQGVTEADVFRIAQELTTPDAQEKLTQFLHKALHSTEELPLAEQLAGHGVQLSFVDGGAPSFGIKLAPDMNDKEVRISTVFKGSAAEKAGLAAHDLLLAVDGLRVLPGQLEKLLASFAVGERVEVHVFRRDELMQFRVRLQAAEPKACQLALLETSSQDILQLRAKWLNPDKKNPPRFQRRRA